MAFGSLLEGTGSIGAVSAIFYLSNEEARRVARAQSCDTGSARAVLLVLSTEIGMCRTRSQPALSRY